MHLHRHLSGHLATPSNPVSESGAKSWISARFMGNVGAPLDLSAHEERHHGTDDDDDFVTYVRSNPLIAGLEAARLEDDSCAICYTP